MIAKRIESLAEVARVAMAEHDLRFPLRDFLDGFYAEPGLEKLQEEPLVLGETLNDGNFADAYLAAVCDQLCRTHRWPRPSWIKSSVRVLKKPYFAAKSHGLRMILLQESPAAFRERNIFVSANAISRA